MLFSPERFRVVPHPVGGTTWERVDAISSPAASPRTVDFEALQAFVWVSYIGQEVSQAAKQAP